MSTRCHIGIILNDNDRKINRTLTTNDGFSMTLDSNKPCLRIYVHSDGYPEGVGKNLVENLSTYNDVLDYILHGNRSTYDTSYVDMGEYYEENMPRSIDDPRNNQKIGQEYFYLFDNGEWYYRNWVHNDWHILEVKN